MKSAEAKEKIIHSCKFTHTFWRDMQGPTSPNYDRLLPLLNHLWC